MGRWCYTGIMTGQIVYIAACFLLSMILEVKLEEIMINQDSVVLSEIGQENITTVFKFLNKEFKGQISDGWRDVLLDVQKEAETQTPTKNNVISEEHPISTFDNARPEIVGGPKLTKSSAIAGIGKIERPASPAIVCKIKQKRPRCRRRLICRRLGSVIAVRPCPRN